MKKYSSCAWLFTALSLTCTASQAFGPIVTSVIFTCPCVHTIKLVDDLLEGPGTELIVNNNNPILFSSERYVPNIPPVLFNYSIAGVNYESVTGLVTCDYQSSNSTEGVFALKYRVMNGLGGIIQASTNYSIMVGFPLG